MNISCRHTLIRKRVVSFGILPLLFKFFNGNERILVNIG